MSGEIKMEVFDIILDEITNSLMTSGIKKGDVVMMHSGVGGIMRALKEITIPKDQRGSFACKALYDGMQNVVKHDAGTICVPGFFYEYARTGVAFDAKMSVPDKNLGEFPNYFFKNHMMARSLSPTVNIMAVGKNATEICCPQSVYGNGLLSPWAKMHDANAWIVFWGSSPETMTFTHHVELLAGVPHIYSKLYNTTIWDLEKNQYNGAYNAVRYLDPRFNINYNLSPFIQDLLNAGVMRSHKWRNVSFFVCRMPKVQQFLLEHLQKNPYYLLSTPPEFPEGVLPNDGPKSPTSL